MTSSARREPPRLRFGLELYSPAPRPPDGHGPFTTQALAQGRTPRVEFRLTRIGAPAEVAERLRIEPGTPVVERENRCFVDDELFQICLTYAVWSLVEGSPLADSADLGPEGLYGHFGAVGHAITRVRDEISARMPTRDEVEGMAIPDGVPVLDLWHTAIDAQREPFEVSRFVRRADLADLDYEMPIGG